ncbi:MAG: LysM peptidoglycan-binding domain-containing protein [Candidatus Glassbacteria bacterium]
MLSATFACSGGGEKNPAEALARIAGEMASASDLREVRFEDLNGDGVREVLLVYGPRELLNFDVYYRSENGDWTITPMINDKQNPREFVSTRLDSVSDTDGDSRKEIQVSSRLYDGNTMVKEIHWGPQGYEVINQHTVIVRQEPPKTETAADAQPVQKKPEPEPPKVEPIPPITPSWGTYLVKKGDTVYGLADNLGSSLDELEKFNNSELASRGLRIGQRIRVPVPRNHNDKVSVTIEKEEYIVKSGDTLIGIAQQQGVSVRALQSWNHALLADGTVKVGQKLRIHRAVIDIKS